ncbi:hypothetical protein D1007_04151 [Hordeum vulgare]|nr:hypothetical protein D1007_04151 [Hordeum vulgare]
METSVLRGTKPHLISSFFYPKVVETSISFKDLQVELINTYPWSDADAVELNYFSSDEKRFLPLTCDDHMPLLFAGIAGCRFGKLQIDVLQPRVERVKGKGVQTSSVCANSQHPGTPCRSTPSKASGSWSHNMPATNCGSDSAAASRVPSAVGVEEDAEPDEAVPTNDDEDEMMFPELVDVASQQAVDGEYMEEPISQARFDDTDDEEKVENMDSLIEDEYDGDDMPTIEWNREKPELSVALHGKLFEKYKIEIPYMRIFNAREKALDRINGQWNDSFQLLYTFKAEVEMASPGSVVEIDKHTVQFKIKGKSFQKECFRRAFEYMDAHHGKVWSRSKFNEICKVDYVTSKLAECFNSKFKSVKGLLLWQAFDKMRQMIMIKMALRKRIAETQYVGHQMLPSLIKALHLKARGLKMKCIRSGTYEGEVTYTDTKNRVWRYPVNLSTRECTCRQWQIRGKPCIHALHLMTVIGGADGEVDQYCSEYFCVAKFMAAYADNVPALLGKDQWNIVDPGFKLHAPVITRPPGRPRNQRIRAGEEGRLTKKRACKKYGVLGHIARLCTNAVDASFGEEERWTTANAEENATAMEIEDAVENAAAMEIEDAVENAAANEAEDFETMAFDGFEAIREEEEGVIVPIVPLKITEPIDDRQMVVKCSASGTTPSTPPRGKHQVKPKIKRNKSLKEKSISTRETRSKTVKRAANTRSKSKI